MAENRVDPLDEIVGLCSDAQAAAAAASKFGGVHYANHAGEKDSRPYSALVRIPSSADKLEQLAPIADVGLYRTTTRTIKALPDSIALGPDRCIASFGLVRNPALTHAECDAHWRDTHGPLALQMHSAMCDYLQISIDQVVHGLELDGIALCAFENRSDLSAKFFNDDDAKAAIIADVTKFSAAAASPPRVVLQQTM